MSDVELARAKNALKSSAPPQKGGIWPLFGPWLRTGFKGSNQNLGNSLDGFGFTIFLCQVLMTHMSFVVLWGA